MIETENYTARFLYTIYDEEERSYEPPICLATPPEMTVSDLRKAAMRGHIQFPNSKKVLLIGFFDDNTGTVKPTDPVVIGDLKIPELDRFKQERPGAYEQILREMAADYIKNKMEKENAHVEA